MTALPRLALRTNYRECYDYCFAAAGDAVFHRMQLSACPELPQLSRRELFKFMENFGIETVPHGLVSDLLRAYDPPQGLVIYLDEYAHGGNGKIRVSAQEAQEKYRDYYASVFMGTPGRAQRHFQFGNRAFIMPFFSLNDWRCQKGQQFSWCIPGEVQPLFPHVPLPYFAADFIPGTRMATDFQTCPGTKDDGLDRWLTPRAMYRALQEAAAVLLEKGPLEGGAHLGYGLSLA